VLFHSLEQEFDECLEVIDDCLDKVKQLSEYPLYVKGLIRRQQGNIQESLRLFQQAACLNPLNVNNLKQVGRSLFLLGKHKAALQVFEEALRVGGGAYVDDWEIWHNKGLCLSYLKKPEEAKESFLRANSIQRHDCTFMQLGQLFTQQEDYKGAIEVPFRNAQALARTTSCCMSIRRFRAAWRSGHTTSLPVAWMAAQQSHSKAGFALPLLPLLALTLPPPPPPFAFLERERERPHPHPHPYPTPISVQSRGAWCACP
jgi:hypothetical protein